MKDFMERWNNEPKFKTKVQLSLYTLFVVVVSIFAISNRPTELPENIIEQDTNNNVTEAENNEIEIPLKYNYITNITINNDNYKYSGMKDNQTETITKQVNGTITNYKLEDNNYYKEYENDYILTTKEEIYDVVDETYIKLDTINQYLSKSTKENDNYIIYLKDIILGNTSEDYITITKEINKVKVDYTKLLQNFDKNIESYIIEIEIEEIE